MRVGQVKNNYVPKYGVKRLTPLWDCVAPSSTAVPGLTVCCGRAASAILPSLAANSKACKRHHQYRFARTQTCTERRTHADVLMGAHFDSKFPGSP